MLGIRTKKNEQSKFHPDNRQIWLNAKLLGNLKLALTRTKIDFLWFCSYIYCNFTLDNAKTSLTRSFFFPFNATPNNSNPISRLP